MSAFVETAIESVRSRPSSSGRSAEKYGLLLERIEREAEAASQTKAQGRVWDLARQQGVEPIRSISALRGDFWPEHESTAEFLSWLRASRDEDTHRNIP
jgi:hypothetical protein